MRGFVDTRGCASVLPVKLKVHESVFVPLAKWAMLLTGNYRCVQAQAAPVIKDAVTSGMAASRGVCDWVRSVRIALGAAEAELVPFEKYAQAANGLLKPSSNPRWFARAMSVPR